jgi:hypothetical protein
MTMQKATKSGIEQLSNYVENAKNIKNLYLEA